MKKKKVLTAILAAVLVCAVIVGIVILTRVGRRPFRNLTVSDIASASVCLVPPDETIPISDLVELVSYLNEVVIYRQDSSYTEYSGQGVIFTLMMEDGTQTEVNAYNPFVVIDGTGYRTKYEPCEKLNGYANRLLRETESSGQTTDEIEKSAGGEPEPEPDTEPVANGMLQEDTVNEVAIKAHIKEIDQNTLTISSDSDGYPGAFLVEVPEDVMDVAALAGGDAIVIHMIDSGSESQGMKEFQAYSILTEEEIEMMTAQHQVLLTGAPILTLTDALSSSMSGVELHSSGFTWNYEKEKGQMESVVACGAAPLDAAISDKLKTLEIPDYNGMDKVPYLLNTVIPPDEVVLMEWDAEAIGNIEAEPVRTVHYFCPPFLLTLRADAIYEINGVWEEENAESNGFYGNAGYVFKTR